MEKYFHVDVLALGADNKPAIAVARNNCVTVISGFGNLEISDSFSEYENIVTGFADSIRKCGGCITCDMHPDYFSTRLSRSFNEIPNIISVQHHHAHVVSCMADNDVYEPVIGVAFDGTGFGMDGTIWGGEFLLADAGGFARVASLAPVPMPGGDSAVLHPWRMAFSYLAKEGLENAEEFFHDRADKTQIKIIGQALEKNINCPLTTSAGRLFDAVSCMIQFRESIELEGQAAMELEKLSSGVAIAETYEYDVRKIEGQLISNGKVPECAARLNRMIDFLPVIRSIAADVERGEDKGFMASRFHSTVADMIKTICNDIRWETGINTVALTGGVFQNVRLLEETRELITGQGMRVLEHKRVSCNDTGIPLGQAVIANEMFERQ